MIEEDLTAMITEEEIDRLSAILTHGRKGSRIADCWTMARKVQEITSKCTVAVAGSYGPAADWTVQRVKCVEDRYVESACTPLLPHLDVALSPSRL